MARTALVYTDNPGGLPAEYSLPAGLELILQSVVAEFDGTGASGAFYPCLSVYSQDDKLIGRFFPSTSFAVGDTGVVTFAPFLDAGGSSSSSGFAPHDAYVEQATGFSVPTVGPVPVKWDVFRRSSDAWSTGDAVSGGNNAPGDTYLWISKPGMYAVTVNVEPDSAWTSGEFFLSCGGVANTVTNRSIPVSVAALVPWRSPTLYRNSMTGLLHLETSDVPASFGLLATNGDAVARNVWAHMSVAKIGDLPMSVVY